ncbi:MAG: GNAT family N-acetyltransferase [Chitinophagaceae bacterium]|nr:GNAT family N-acetyltransferase [Chitinophagaceae bacterium]MCA6453436.1 GNAT family N-acetyltransferase [Chitinophagaceae bacterium]MCA6455243.1 GNAT family N-acetyltransferase [Chitinophagaceae bacterium]MCA6460043.1 GNAT family N-acetyltransferase [Chitinophagaceae bacterium]MCA6465396.1 GNAT family N-acetyltransferase [Chitinophagaceae bacterium]
MQTLITRPATVADIDTLRLFEQGVIEAERPYDPTLKNGTIHYYDLELLINSPASVLMVVELNGELLASGYARVETAKPYLQHSQHAYLGFMYTHPTHRGKGLNKLVLDALKQWARERGITELRLEVYHNNRSAIRAYEKAGFSQLMIEMRMGI